MDRASRVLGWSAVLALLAVAACSPAPPPSTAPPTAPAATKLPAPTAAPAATQLPAPTTASAANQVPAPTAAPAATQLPAAPAPTRPPPVPTVAPTAGPSTHLVVSYSEMSTSPLPLWTAVDNGLFAKHGIDIDSQYIPSTTGVAGLLSGSTNVAFLGGSDILGAVTDGADLVILADVVNVYPYELLVEPSITDVTQLKGKTFGISNFGSSSDVATRVLLKKFGLDPSTDVNIVAVGSASNRAAALLGGAIQAEVDAPPNSLPLEAAGFKVLYNLAANGLPNLNSAMVVRRSWRDSNREVVQRFVDAEIEGLNLVRSNPDLAATSLANTLKLDPDVANQSTHWAVANVYATVPLVRPEAFADSLDVLAQTNEKLKDFDVNTIIDNSFVQDAQKRGLTVSQ